MKTRGTRMDLKAPFMKLHPPQLFNILQLKGQVMTDLDLKSRTWPFSEKHNGFP